MSEPMFRESPWMVSIGHYIPGTCQANLASIYFEPDDVDTSKPFDIDDYAHSEASFDFTQRTSLKLLEKAAWSSGAYMAKLFGQDEIKIWPGFGLGAERACRTQPGDQERAKIVPSEPDKILKQKMAYLRIGLEHYLWTRPIRQDPDPDGQPDGNPIE